MHAHGIFSTSKGKGILFPLWDDKSLNPPPVMNGRLLTYTKYEMLYTRQVYVIRGIPRGAGGRRVARARGAGGGGGLRGPRRAAAAGAPAGGRPPAGALLRPAAHCAALLQDC